MSVASRFRPFNREQVFYDSETWEALFGNALEDEPDMAEPLARLLFKIIRELEDQEKGPQRVINTLKLGLECIYPFTDSHKLSFQGFLYHLEGPPNGVHLTKLLPTIFNTSLTTASTDPTRPNNQGAGNRPAPTHARCASSSDHTCCKFIVILRG